MTFRARGGKILEKGFNSFIIPYYGYFVSSAYTLLCWYLRSYERVNNNDKKKYGISTRRLRRGINRRFEGRKKGSRRRRNNVRKGEKKGEKRENGERRGRRKLKGDDAGGGRVEGT